MEQVTGLELEGTVKKVIAGSGSYTARAVILACGSDRRKLGVPGEEQFSGRGVSYCATCDGKFFKNRAVAVVGGGNSAAEYAIELASLCQSVTLVYHGKELKSMFSLREKLKSLQNVTVLYNSEVREITGESVVRSIRMENTGDGTTPDIRISVSPVDRSQFGTAFRCPAASRRICSGR